MEEKLRKIQLNLNVPKDQRNNFGGYNYRSCEDILEAVKPHLEDGKISLIITDELVNIGERYYIKATVTLSDGNDKIQVTGYAREEENKKGMDGSQITGASSSYARKYALNGMFLIDDTKDSDHTNQGEDKKPDPVTPKKCGNPKCAVKLSNQVAEYSIGKFKKPYCKDCQKVILDNVASKKRAKEDEVDIDGIDFGEE